MVAWRRSGQLMKAESPRAWLLGVTRNVVRHLYRRRVGEPDRFEDIDLLQLGTEAGWGSSERTILDSLGEAEYLERALGALSVPDREIITLRELEGLTGEEVSRLLGLSLAAQKSRLHRARLRLAAELRRIPHG